MKTGKEDTLVMIILRTIGTISVVIFAICLVIAIPTVKSGKFQIIIPLLISLIIGIVSISIYSFMEDNRK